MQQNLPHLLLLAYSAVAFSCLLDYLAPYFRGCRCRDIAAARSYAYVCIRHSCDECPQQLPISAAPLFPVAPVHRSFIALSSHLHHTFIARSSHYHRTFIARSSLVHRTTIAPASYVHRPYIALSLHVQPTYSTRSSYVFLRVNYVRTFSSGVGIGFSRVRVRAFP